MLVPGSAGEPVAVFFRSQFIGGDADIGVIGDAWICQTLTVGKRYMAALQG